MTAGQQIREEGRQEGRPWLELGLTEEPSPSGLCAQDPLQLLLAEASEVRQFCERVGTVSLFGFLRPQLDGDLDTIGSVLSSRMVGALREYDLELGTTLIRAVRYLRIPRTSVIASALEFLVDQQFADGRFGRYAMDLAAMCAMEADDEAPARKLFLPITVSAIWTLAEELGVNLFATSLAPRSHTRSQVPARRMASRLTRSAPTCSAQPHAVAGSGEAHGRLTAPRLREHGAPPDDPATGALSLLGKLGLPRANTLPQPFRGATHRTDPAPEMDPGRVLP